MAQRVVNGCPIVDHTAHLGDSGLAIAEVHCCDKGFPRLAKASSRSELQLRPCAPSRSLRASTANSTGFQTPTFNVTWRAMVVEASATQRVGELGTYLSEQNTLTTGSTTPGDVLVDGLCAVIYATLFLRTRNSHEAMPDALSKHAGRGVQYLNGAPDGRRFPLSRSGRGLVPVGAPRAHRRDVRTGRGFGSRSPARTCVWVLPQPTLTRILDKVHLFCKRCS